MGTHPRTLTLAAFNMVTALHVGVCHTNKAQSLTVLGGSVSKHHPQVAAAHVFNGNRHLARTRKKKGTGIRKCANTGLYIWNKCSWEIYI